MAKKDNVRALAGLAMLVAIVLIVTLSVGLFRGSFTETVPLTVVSERAGLVMNPDARVKLNGAQIGKVESIELLSDGRAALHLAIDPTGPFTAFEVAAQRVPARVLVVHPIEVVVPHGGATAATEVESPEQRGAGSRWGGVGSLGDAVGGGSTLAPRFRRVYSGN